MKEKLKKKRLLLAWQQRAKKVREILSKKFAVLEQFEFKDKLESFNFGSFFWDRVTAIGYANPGEIEAVLNQFVNSKGNDAVYWLHSDAEDTGIIEAKLEKVIKLIFTRGINESDILIMGKNFQYGICYEISEHENFLRFWQD